MAQDASVVGTAAAVHALPLQLWVAQLLFQQGFNAVTKLPLHVVAPRDLSRAIAEDMRPAVCNDGRDWGGSKDGH